MTQPAYSPFIIKLNRTSFLCVHLYIKEEPQLCSKCSESAKGQQQYAVRYEVQGQEKLVGLNFYWNTCICFTGLEGIVLFCQMKPNKCRKCPQLESYILIWDTSLIISLPGWQTSQTWPTSSAIGSENGLWAVLNAASDKGLPCRRSKNHSMTNKETEFWTWVGIISQISTTSSVQLCNTKPTKRTYRCSISTM